MFQLHGWAEILTTTSGDEDSEISGAVVDWFCGAVVDAGLKDRIDVIGRGGSYVVRANLVQNRDRGDLDRCCDLLRELGLRATGTYGIFFVRDDEAGPGFKQIALRRGLVDVEEDGVLSPIVPRLEDP